MYFLRTHIRDDLPQNGALRQNGAPNLRSRGARFAGFDCTSLISFLDYNKKCLSWGGRSGYIHLANTCPIDSFLTSLNLCNSDVAHAIEISEFDLKSHPEVQTILLQLVQKVRLAKKNYLSIILINSTQDNI